MKNFSQSNYKTLFPNSIISKNKLLYRKTNKELNIFLNENFSDNPSINYKFPIKFILAKNKKLPLKRKNALSSKYKNSQKKSNIRRLIDSLRSDNLISYNYYDNTKGQPGSAKARVDNTLKYSIISNSSINDSRHKKNSYKMRNNLSLKQKNIFKNRFFSQKDLSHEFHNFSFSNLFPSKRENNSKCSNSPLTPSSTKYKSRRNSTQFINSLSFNLNNSISKKSGNRSSFSAKSKNKKGNIKIDIDYLINRKINKSDIEFSREQRKFHQKTYLYNIKKKVQDFENSNAFYVDDNQIKTNLISLDKFQRNKFTKRIKKAAKENDFFFKRSPVQSPKYENIKHIKKKLKKNRNLPHLNLCSNKTKVVLKNIEKLQNRYKASRNFIKNLNFRLRTNDLKRIIDVVVPFENKVKDIDKQFKGETLNYQKEIGKFFIYKGIGVYAGHLSTILRGDKIVKQEIKFDDKNFI